MRLLDACQRNPVDATPVWFMRQAGRSLPSYRRLRESYGFKEISKDPELAAKVTLMPLEVLDVDAAILFADLMTPLAMLDVSYEIVEGIGPVLEQPVDTPSLMEGLALRPAAETVPEVFETIRLVRKEIEGKVPLIGFAGAPFTIASYLIEGRGSKDMLKTKRLMYDEPRAFSRLLSTLSNMAIDYLREQVSSGAQAFQLFDSWVGVLSPADYSSRVLPHTRRIFEETKGLGVPRIHFGTQTAGLLEHFANAGSEVVGVDHRIGLAAAWERIGPRAIQGNLDPASVLCGQQTLESSVSAVLREADGRSGHIFNLGHGVLPDTSLANLQRVVDFVHNWEVKS